MSLKSKIILHSLFGAIGGFVGWALIEVLLRGFFAVSTHESMQIAVAQAEFGLLAGFFIGAMLGAADGLSSGSSRALRRAVIVGGLVGAAGGFVGLAIGQAVFDLFAQPDASGKGSIFSFFMLVIGRAFGWAIAGAVIGSAQGFACLSLTRLKHGTIGGLVGGFIGGASFDILKFILWSDVFSRLASLVLTGFCIGFMVALIQDLLKQAWIVVLRGRGEGREIPIHQPLTIIGRDELVQVPIFADPNVAAKHAVIKREATRHVLEDLGSPLGTSVNGQPVTRQMLKDRDTIEVGSVKLLFREKATASRYIPPPETPRSGEASHIPTSDRVCPFCGAIKDASGNCDCTVGAAPAAPPIPGQGQATNVLSTGQTNPFGPPAAVPPATGVARLTVLSGPHAPGSFDLRPVETSIGREDGRDICLSGDSAVSRHHARVVREEMGFVVYDEGSSNGTFVNGGRVTRVTLAPGDTIRAGSTELRFEV